MNFKMLKKILFISCLSILYGCSAPGTAFLGPVITGAKTGSIYQASLSYGTGKIMDQISNSKDNSIVEKKEKQITHSLEIIQMPYILSTYVVNEIKISEVLEPEPLP